MQQRIVIVDYGTGNLHSVKKRIEHMGVDVEISRLSSDIGAANKLILPGVGHFKSAVENLQALKLWDALNDAVLSRKTPVLGICLGLQLMARQSEEGNIEGLGWFNAEVVRFTIEDKLKYKVPHMGWNRLVKLKENPLMRAIPDAAEFYFAHSYHLQCHDPADVLNETEYEGRFPATVARDNVFGVQYHPEKSHGAGERLLRNFLDL